MDNSNRAAFEAWYGSTRSEYEGSEQSSYDDCWGAWQAALSRSQDAPRCQCCGYLVTESEHRGCLRSAERSQDVARVALNDEQRRDIQECIDYLTPAAKDFSDLGMVGMGDSKHARCIRVLRSLLAPQPPQAGANLPCPICRGIEGCDHTVPERSRAATLAPATAEPKGEQHDDYEAKGTIEHLDLDNHRLRRAMQKIMARLAELLDEDQFANIESIVKGVGVEPPEPRAAPIGKVLSDAEMFDAKMDGKSGNVIWFNAPKPGFIYAAPAEQRAATLFCDLKSDAEKSNFFLSGRAYETGVIAREIQNDVAMAYHRCAEYAKQSAATLTAEQIDAFAERMVFVSKEMGRQIIRDVLSTLNGGKNA